MMANRILVIVLLLFTLSSFGYTQNTDCNHLPETFASYQEAQKRIQSTTFKIKEQVTTTKSSWIRGVTYFSCDGKSGFFLFQTKKKSYIHSGVPYTVWIAFKKADSFGSFYNSNIKNKYKLLLNNHHDILSDYIKSKCFFWQV